MFSTRDVVTFQEFSMTSFNIYHKSFFLGFIGPNCESICERWNPCKEGSTCVPSTARAEGYKCVCAAGRSGRYCDQQQQSSCPLSWWGHPICGPCNCNTQKGFDPSCNKTTGQCVCKVNPHVCLFTKGTFDVVF